VNDDKVDTVPFNEVDQIGKADFSDKINRLYKTYSGRKDVTIRLAVEDYKYNTRGQGFQLSYLVQADYNDTLPPSAPNSLISFDLSESTPLSDLPNVGQIQTQTIKIKNKDSKQAQGMSVAIISVPSCLTVELTQLELLKEAGQIDNFEVSADNTLITLYWTYLTAGQSKQVTLARTRQYVSEVCLSRASQAYLYYDDD
jgi:hypothetical protein